jgi:hypothetical protein
MDRASGGAPAGSQGRGWWAGGAGPAGARTPPARPLPAAMLAGVWVSNAARASVAPASPALPAAAAAHSRWPRGAEVSGAEVSRDPRGWEALHPGRGRGQSTSFSHLRSPLACTPGASAGPHPGRDSLLSNQAPPHRLEHGPFRIGIPLNASRTPSVSLSGSSPYILGVWGFPYSHLRSGSPLPRAHSSFPGARRPFLQSLVSLSLPCRVTAQPPSRNRGRGPLLCAESRLVSFSFGWTRAPLPLRGLDLPPPQPPPAQRRGDGGGRARFQLPFVPRGMAETRPCGPARLIRGG